MARSKRDKQRAQKFMSILDPENIDLSDFTAETKQGKAFTNDQLGNIDNVSNRPSVDSRGTVKKSSNTQLAGTSTDSPFDTSTDRQPSIRPGSTSTRELLQDPNSNIIQTKIPFTPRAASYNPLLFGVGNSKQLASNYLQDFQSSNNSPDIMSMQPMTPGNTIRAKQSPEEKLITALSNTNPSPQGTWKRLLSGVGRGLKSSAGAFERGDYGSAFGNIASQTIASLIPGVDSATQYDANKAQAIETFKYEKLAEDSALQRRKTEADISETNERLRLSSEQKAQQLKRDAMLDAARLRDDKRADADQVLKILEKLPADDPQRNELSRDLATKYQMKVSPRYGVDSGEQITIYDEQSGNYIRATKDGTPITDAQGNTITVRPGRVDSPRESKDKAMQQVIKKYGGDAKSVARLSVENRKDQIISSLHPDYAKALRNPSSTNAMVLTDAQKAYDDAFNKMLKTDEAFTQALFEREASELMNSPTPRQSTSRQSSGKVKSSVTPGYFVKFK